MVLLKELSLAVFLLLASAFQVWGQPACTSHLLPNRTVDIDQYNNTGLHVVKRLTISVMVDCSLVCCETGNCSLVIFTDDKTNNCLLIHCMFEEACDPIPSNSSNWIESIRNNEPDSNYTLTAAESTSASNPTDMTDKTNPDKTTLFQENTYPNSDSENNTELSPSSNSSIALVESSDNATDLGSNNNTVVLTTISSDNVTVENTTGFNVSDAQELEPSNTTSSNESLGTTTNSTGMVSLNDTTESAEAVTDRVLPSSPGANITSSLENGTMSVPQKSTDVPAVIIGANSTSSTNGTIPSFNGLNGDGTGNNTASAEAADSSEGAAPAVASNESMMVVLVATLSVGMLLFIAIIAVVSKKAVDGWQRRHYSRIDYLVNGMYN